MKDKFFDSLREIMPRAMLELYRSLKKDAVRKDLEKQRVAGHAITKKRLLEQLREMGIVAGDHLMVHTAMSKMGYLENGPQTVIDALLEAVGPTGTVCMPSSPVSKLQLVHLRQNPVFDIHNTPSAMGSISEQFRKLPATVRSLHPTEPVCAQGALAAEFVKDHFAQLTPYNANSPWKKLMDANGKILYVGVTLINAGTHLHTLEDAVDFKYPVYAEEIFTAKLIDANGKACTMQTKVHNPEFSRRRRCDELIPYFKTKGILQKTHLGRADCLLLNAKGMFDVMLKGYQEKRITMYTPHGEKIPGFDD